MAAVPRLVRRVGEAVTLTAMSAFTSGQLAVRRAQQEVEMVVDTLTELLYMSTPSVMHADITEREGIMH